MMIMITFLIDKCLRKPGLFNYKRDQKLNLQKEQLCCQSQLNH